MKKFVKDLKSGDQTDWYKVKMVMVEANQVKASVDFNDGGSGIRVWDDPNLVIQIKDK